APGVFQEHPEIAQYTHWHDTYALDSIYDYDPVWAKCAELGVAPTFHTPGYGFTRSSLSNFMANHIGAFAAAGDGITRSLFMGGVPKRFPSLRFGIMEGGVGFAVSLYCDMIGHWSRRNRDLILDYHPRKLDRGLLGRLFATYGAPAVQKRLETIDKSEWGFRTDGQIEKTAAELD